MPVMRSFGVFFDLHPNKRLSKQWWGWWFETPPSTLWRHCNVTRWTSHIPVSTKRDTSLALILFSSQYIFLAFMIAEMVNSVLNTSAAITLFSKSLIRMIWYFLLGKLIQDIFFHCRIHLLSLMCWIECRFPPICRQANSQRELPMILMLPRSWFRNVFVSITSVIIVFPQSQTQTDSYSDSDKIYSTKIYTSTISVLHGFLKNTNNAIVLIYK